MAVPIIWPRCSFGAAPAIQAIAPAHDAAAADALHEAGRGPAAATVCANAKPTLATVISARPSSTVGFTPTRAAM